MSTVNKQETAIVALSKQGAELGRRLKVLLPASDLYLPQKFAVKEKDTYAYELPPGKLIAEIFNKYRGIVFIMATGITIRLIAPHVNSKHQDPAVVAIDDEGKFAVSILSGHIGGANSLALKVASLTGAEPVITTASDSRGIIAPDLLAKSKGWGIEKGSALTEVSAALVNGEKVGVYQDAGETDWQQGISPKIKVFKGLDALVKSDCTAAIIISDRVFDKKRLSVPAVVFRPKSLTVGIGCNRGTTAADIEKAIDAVFAENGLSTASIRSLATIDLKEDEAGLLKYARKHKLPLEYFDKDLLNKVKFPSHPSPLVLKHVGVASVCEPAAILAGGSDLIVRKTGYKRMITAAVSRLRPAEKVLVGQLFLIGIGPGDPDQMTVRARQVMADCEVIIGYSSYIEQVKHLISHKKIFSTGMGKEIERVNEALNLAAQGKTVALLSGGDSGVYGMAGLVCEMLLHRDSRPYVEVIPGVPSVIAGAALLGAPLNGDVASISLSDYLVPWESIVKRLHMAAEGDFVIALYNPKSKKRRDQLDEAQKIIMKYRSPSTPVGIVNNAYRPGQQVVIASLKDMTCFNIDMNTIIIVGNSNTLTGNGMMISPRGYHTKYDLKKTEPSGKRGKKQVKKKI